MSNIENNLETIRKGVYGKDVRQAIHDAIEECYADGHAGAVDLIARERINTLIGGTGDLVEVPLFEELELFAYDQTFTIDPDEYSISDFDYIAVYYKVVASGAPEVKWYTANDFLTLPVVISGVFLENAGHKLSAREIHIRCTDTDDQTFEVYLANNWKLNGSDAADGGTYTEVEATDEEKAGIISMISGIKFAPSAEVADIRVGEDGTTYESAGEAVRTQISDLKSQITNGVPRAVKLAMDAMFANMAVENDDVYSDEYAIIHAWATAVNVVSISASFDQGDNLIFSTDDLDSLKQYLTVTATYDDETTATLSDSAYALSGTLADGTSVITVNYDGKTTSFNASVIGAEEVTVDWATPPGVTANTLYSYNSETGSLRVYRTASTATYQQIRYILPMLDGYTYLFKFHAERTLGVIGGCYEDSNGSIYTGTGQGWTTVSGDYQSEISMIPNESTDTSVLLCFFCTGATKEKGDVTYSNLKLIKYQTPQGA